MNPANIPDFLKEHKGWLVWKAIDNGGLKPVKMPYYITGGARKGEQGSPGDRTQLATFNDALAAYNGGGYTGLGLAMLPEWNLTALDFDNCVTDGVVLPEVLSIVDGLYNEISPSGMGLRAFMQADLGNYKSHADKWGWGFETFHSKGFVTVTGNTNSLGSLIPNPVTYARLIKLCTERFNKADAPNLLNAISSIKMKEEEIKQLLSRIDPDVGYGDWLQAGMSIHHETSGKGFLLWDEWSAKGRKYHGRNELVAKWSSFGKSTDRPVTIATLAKMAGVSLPIMFANTAPALARFTPIHVSDFIKQPAPSWLVKYLIPAKGIAMLYGASGAGKSFWVLDLMLAIVRGLPWRGHKVKKGRVVYIAAESAAGLNPRCRAAALHFELNLAEFNLFLIPESPNFFSGSDAINLMQAIKQAGGADVVVIDTLAQVTAGANENAGEDMGKVFATLQELQKSLDCLVLLVHHAGKDSSKGARGWSGMQAALDAVIEITKTPEGHIAKVIKQKDGADGSIYPFRLLPVTLGWDDDGDIVSSCVAEQVEDTPKPKAPQGKLQKAIWEAIIEGAVITFEDIAPALERKMGKAPRGDAIRRAIDNMIERGFILERTGIISLPQSHKSPQIDVCGNEAKSATISTTTTTPYRGVDVWDVEGKENDA